MSKKLLIQAYDIIPHGVSSYIGGIGRSNVELLSALSKIPDKDIDIHIYCNGKNCIGFQHYGWNFGYHPFPFPSHISNYRTSFESWYRKYIIGYDLLHYTNNVGNMRWDTQFVVTIHDMYRYNSSPWNKQHFHECANKSSGIVTCSNFSKEEIVNILKVEPSKVSVIPWGISHSLFHAYSERDIESILRKYNIKDKYFFACSCSNPRKNGDVIAEAAHLLADKTISVVLAWSNPPKKLLDNYQKEIESRQLIFLNYLSDEELAILYTGALASIFVSSFEGFGFPILESMACGTPCITCKNSSLIEVGGNLAFYVKEKDSNDLADAMRSFTKNNEINSNEMISYSQGFSWEKKAREYIRVYKKYL